MRFGTTEQTTTTDAEGSTITIETNIRDFKTVKPIKKHISERVRVKNKKDEMTEYLKFSDSLTDDKLDPGFKIVRTQEGKKNGYYYVVKSYTILEY